MCTYVPPPPATAPFRDTIVLSSTQPLFFNLDDAARVKPPAWVIYGGYRWDCRADRTRRDSRVHAVLRAKVITIQAKTR
jgi:hypothetical protein